MDKGTRRERHQVRPHHLAHKLNLQRIHFILPAQMEPATAHLLGQDRPLHHQHRHRIGDHVGHQQRQQRAEIVRQLQRKDNPRERRPHRAPKDRAHAHQRPEARAHSRQEHRLHTTQRPAHHQQRSEHASRGARPERDGPDNGLHDEDADDHANRDVALNERADRLVAHAERFGKNQPPAPMARPPRAGHHIQWMGSFANASSAP